MSENWLSGDELKKLLEEEGIELEQQEGGETRPDKETIEVKAMNLEELDDEQTGVPELIPGFEILYDVPLDIRVVLGSTEKTIEEVLKLEVDSIVKLSKLAGESVEVLAGGELIAKGETVIVDDKFGVLISEIVSEKERVRKLEEKLRIQSEEIDGGE